MSASTATTDATGCGYRRDYRVSAAAGRCQVQRVLVRIRYLVAGRLVADYRQRYAEFFAFDTDDGALIDTHDFDLMRDGWRQSVIAGLVRAGRGRDAASLRGEARLCVHKQFTIGAGVVRDVEPRELAPGARFGLLLDGPSGRSRTRLSIARDDGTWSHRDDLPPCPPGYPVAGRGAFASGRRARAVEVFHYRFATLAGRFADRCTRGYLQPSQTP